MDEIWRSQSFGVELAEHYMSFPVSDVEINPFFDSCADRMPQPLIGAFFMARKIVNNKYDIVNPQKNFADSG